MAHMVPKTPAVTFFNPTLISQGFSSWQRAASLSTIPMVPSPADGSRGWRVDSPGAGGQGQRGDQNQNSPHRLKTHILCKDVL